MIQRRLGDDRNKPGDIFYASESSKIDILQIIEIIEGYDDGSQADENANTLVCWDFIAQEEIKIDSRFRITDMYYHDMDGLGDGYRRQYIISRFFEDYLA